MFINFFPTQYLKGFFYSFFIPDHNSYCGLKNVKIYFNQNGRGMNIKKAYSEYHSSMN